MPGSDASAGKSFGYRVPTAYIEMLLETLSEFDIRTRERQFLVDSFNCLPAIPVQYVLLQHDTA